MSRKEQAVLNKMLTDSRFATEVAVQLSPSDFTKEEHQTLFQLLRRHYQAEAGHLDGQELTLMVETKLRERNKTEDEIDEVLAEAMKLYEVPDSGNSETIQKYINEFVTGRLARKKLAENLQPGSLEDPEKLEKIAQELLDIALIDTTGSRDDNFIDFFNDDGKKKELYRKLRRENFPTGLKALDNILDGGGLSKGELALIIAPTGVGKSSIAIQLANNAVKRGLNTLYITLEERLERMTLRMEGNLSGSSMEQLFNEKGELNEGMVDALQNIYREKDHLGQLYIQKYNPKEMTVDTLEQLIVNTTRKKGVKIDYVVIDYPALMKLNFQTANSTQNEYRADGELFERLRGLAQKYNYICTTLAQTNRSAWSAEMVTAEHIEGSKQVLNACELVLTLNRTQEEYENGFLRLHISKIRNRQAGVHIPETIGLKVSTKGYTFRDVTEQEAFEQERMVRTSFRQPKQDNYSKAHDTVSQLNSSFSGGGQ